MPQDRETGAAGNAYGRHMAKIIAKLLRAPMVRPGSNEVRWRDQRAVIKCCGPRTSSLGVTAKMLPKLDTILAALQGDRGQVEVFALSADKFRVAMYDSRSASAVVATVKMVPRAYVTEEGQLVARFSRAEIDGA